jgi:hypothetical protein
MNFEFQIPTRRGRVLPPFQPRPAGEPLGRGPQVARLVAPAHRLEGLVQSGKVKDYRELARLAQVSTARVAQIVVLAQLAPRIQEYLLFLSAEHAGLITELQLREIAREPRWDRQLSLAERTRCLRDRVAGSRAPLLRAPERFGRAMQGNPRSRHPPRAPTDRCARGPGVAVGPTACGLRELSSSSGPIRRATCFTGMLLALSRIVMTL